MTGSEKTRSRDTSPGIEARVSDLVRRLSPEEKVGQLTTLVIPANHEGNDLSGDSPPGFVMAPHGHWRDTSGRIQALQQRLVRLSRWGIPAIFITQRDFIGAVRFPIPIARAAAWSQDLMEEVATAVAFETRAGGATARLGPVAAPLVGPHPVDPADRAQTLGGDPLLAAELLAAHVRGTQGPTLGRIHREGVAVVLTHVGAMASQLAGRPSDVHERTVRGSVLPPAEAAVLAGARLVVPTSAANAGVPGHADSWLLRDVLRHEWGFDGVVLAAPGAVAELAGRHAIATDLDAAHAIALEAGVDVLESSAPNGSSRLLRLLRRGSVPSWVLDDAVAAVLRLKMSLGLLDDWGPLPPDGRVGGLTHRALAHRAATESLVLLADSADVLPLVGAPAIDVLCADPGGAVPDTARLAAALGVALPDCVVRDLGGSDAGEVPGLAGTVIAVVPGDPRVAGTVISRIVAGGRRCVALICSGEVDGAPALASTTAAVLLCWAPIAEQAAAVVDVLIGVTEPGGRLPFALVDTNVQRPARYPLGHGRGYTTFDYSQLQITPDQVSAAEPLTVQFRLTNTGARAGKEIAQVYVRARVGSVTRPRPLLVGFVATHLAAGRSRRIRVTVPAVRLAVWDRTMRRIVEPGDFDVLVGRSATDLRLVGTFPVGPAAGPHTAGMS